MDQTTRDQEAARDPRRHDLDALRAFAMLLGIALHAALSFMEVPWPVQDRFRAPGFGLFVSAIHGFRMPLFFLLSGYFTCMLWRRRGLAGLLRHRARRIALPLALGCVTIVPVMWVVVIAAALGQSTSHAADGPVDTGRDIWTAAAYGNLDALRLHIDGGVAIDGVDPAYGQTVLGWAVIGNQPEVVTILLELGADPRARYPDRNTALHTAAFFGRADIAAQLLDAGADVHARNAQGETPQDALRHDRGTTEFIAGLLQVPVDFAAVSLGRDEIRTMLEDRDGEAVRGADGEIGILSAVVQGLMLFPFFHHLWFLWFLCWLVGGFALVVAAFRRLPRVRLPSVFIATPLCLLWLVPLTMVTQSFMHFGGTLPGFGPDTSAGLLPIPHVLAHHAIFFGFGALMNGATHAADRLGRSWWLQLPLALLLLPAALALGLQTPWGRELVADDSLRRWLACLGQVLFAWLMIFGLMGLFATVLNRARPGVRYVSDSSYWLYLVHLPLIIVGQALLRGIDLPPLVKFTILLSAATVILLASYQWMVRFTWIGTLLNGPRAR